ncbi:uncharacterized protein G2W53_035589 [Senna tora]|uniref:Uncharacterized protein n=1 Tax=Senna tora TaxID=362788 RepID=A0A834STC6_9FABA|nr:uncharacterized protein G2W53_035589 [Senna tora]
MEAESGSGSRVQWVGTKGKRVNYREAQDSPQPCSSDER